MAYINHFRDKIGYILYDTVFTKLPKLLCIIIFNKAPTLLALQKLKGSISMIRLKRLIWLILTSYSICV